MVVTEVTKHSYGTEVAKLNAVSAGSPEDNSYSKSTPCASLEIHIDNPEAHGVLVPGKLYYVDFTKVKEQHQA